MNKKIQYSTTFSDLCLIGSFNIGFIGRCYHTASAFGAWSIISSTYANVRKLEGDFLFSPPHNNFNLKLNNYFVTDSWQAKTGHWTQSWRIKSLRQKGIFHPRNSTINNVQNLDHLDELIPHINKRLTVFHGVCINLFKV